MATKGLDTSTASTLPVKRRTRLLVIGINNYKNDVWPPLHHPVSDCKKLWEVLKKEYGFREEDMIIAPLFDDKATTDVIIDEISLLQQKDEFGELPISPHDNLIIVFSGHGHFANNEGYWIPYDAPPLNVKTARASELRKLISVSEIIKILSNIPAHHLVLIIDSCFSGSFANMEVALPTPVSTANPMELNTEDIPSRWVLTAGRLQLVPDKSEFSQNLIRLLRDNPDGSIPISLLGEQVIMSVRDTTGISPRVENLLDIANRGGVFFFHRENPATTKPTVTSRSQGHEIADLLRKGSERHHERLIKGRYRHLTIENILLAGFSIDESPYALKASDRGDYPLAEALGILWRSPKPHAVLFGEGGMGKTVSLLHLWDRLLNEKHSDPISVFVPLHEFNSADESEKDDFILRYIARHYLQIWELTASVKNELWDLFTRNSPEYPKIILLLDGFNELTVRKDQLLIDLDLISTHAGGIQMVIASRYTDIQNFPWAHRAQTIQLLPLTEQAVATYLRQVNLAMPADPTLRRLFANPMMLTLYAGTNNIAQKYAHNKRYFFREVGSYSELLWNFNEAQLAHLVDSTPYDQDEELYQTFLFRILVPYLAYQMEKKGRYSIASRVSIDPDFNFKVLLETAFEEFNTAELVELYPKFEGKRTLLGLGKLQELDEKEKRVIRVKQYLVEKLRLLVMEGDELRFLHQNFRDFYAACHIRTAIQLTFIKKETPKLLSTYLLPVYLRRMLGEIEGEHRIVPIWNKQTQHLVLPVRENLLSRVLDSCRGKFAATESSDPTTFLIWNIITIWQEIRQTLAGANLTRLDLRKINFNGKDLTSHRGDFYLAAQFEESALDGNRFLFNGHYGQINMALYNAEGNRIVSASDDQKIIEWDTSTGELLQTYIQHTNKVSSVEFSPNRKKILSASYDLTLGERTLGTGKFRFINTGHTNRINHAVYSPDGQTILTASGDATIREFSVKTGKSVHTYTEHEKSVQHISFHPIGDRFLSASADETIREWSVKRKTILRTMKGHSARVTSVCYSPDGNKAVSASDDHTIRIWNMTMEEPPTVLFGHTNAVHSAVFSNDGQKILSASADCTVREWSAASGAVLKIYEGHFDKVNSAFYSPDERKILSASDDKSIREWSVETGSILKIIEGKSIWVGRASGSFNPAGTKFLTVNYDKSLSEFSAHTGLCLQNLRGHTKWVSGAWYSPDGQRILSSSDDQTLREWSVVDGTCLRVYRGHAYGVKEAVYSKDGTMIFSVSFQDEYKEWSAITGDCLLTLTGAEATGRFIERKNENRTQEPGELIVKARKESILVDKASGGNYLTLTNQTGLLVQGCDFRRIHRSSVFTDAVKDSLRNYGALFTDEDEARWRRAVEEANKTE